MDLVASVRKEGSRGGRDAFKWSDVKDSSHRENYLGHSLMAPVGRWQQGRDLSWYAKHNDEDSADAVKNEKEAELQRIKEAEQEAMARALGLPVAPKSATGANATAVSGRDVEKLIKESTGDANETEAELPKGIGFGGYNGLKHAGDDANADRLEAVGMSNDTKRKEPREKRSDDVEINRRRDRPPEREVASMIEKNAATGMKTTMTATNVAGIGPDPQLMRVSEDVRALGTGTGVAGKTIGALVANAAVLPKIANTIAVEQTTMVTGDVAN
ncbi:multiple myeloma tumor-associated protein 2 [Coccidioides immitis RMSCC 3703]|uniref:Multiple myeloma tumor-associated protein 2 n=2 Tax=Coccidioides immitis TaxID=5501 RepID=A0A0J8QZT6_COCIT|nr:hypothetical protein CIRG_09712 [Coccidioides immitis RMSCC 2394]KMU76908.1 multiple myeloma tumor-associated protein 2 [Coccidioides immitis RMSCC 3703]